MGCAGYSDVVVLGEDRRAASRSRLHTRRLMLNPAGREEGEEEEEEEEEVGEEEGTGPIVAPAADGAADSCGIGAPVGCMERNRGAACPDVFLPASTGVLPTIGVIGAASMGALPARTGVFPTAGVAAVGTPAMGPTGGAAERVRPPSTGVLPTTGEALPVNAKGNGIVCCAAVPAVTDPAEPAAVEAGTGTAWRAT
jgi:hypothetical protein